jgi:hypothetical protein
MAHTVVSWHLQPAPLIEEPYSLSTNGAEVSASAGEVAITIPHSPGGVSASRLLQLRTVAEAHAAAAAISRGIGWRLEGPAIAHVGDDGSRTVQLTMGASAVFIVEDVDTLVTDADGTVIHDSRRVRLNRQRELADLFIAAGAEDSLLTYLVEALQRARQRPDYELLHLYEIRDAVSKRFGADKRARKKLGISKDDWSFLGRLANHEPLEGSRHRGEHLAGGAPLPPPTSDQLHRARAIAVAIIEAYARWIVAG